MSRRWRFFLFDFLAYVIYASILLNKHHLQSPGSSWHPPMPRLNSRKGKSGIPFYGQKTAFQRNSTKTWQNEAKETTFFCRKKHESQNQAIIAFMSAVYCKLGYTAPMGLNVLPSSPNDDPSLAQGHPLIIEGHLEIPLFQPTHAGLKMAKSSLARP